MEHTRDSDFLQRLALAAAATLDVKALVGLVIGETTGVMGVDVCSVYLVDAGGDGLMLSATNGLSQAGVGTVRLALGEGITGHAALHRRPTVADDVRRDPRFRWLAGVDQERFVSMCSVPIVSADRLVGVLNVQTDQPHRFGESEVALLGAIAAHVAGALERSALQERLQHQVHELRRSHEIHARFTQLSLGGAGLRAICRAIADHAGAPVGLYDDADVRIAGSDDEALPEALGDADGDGLTVRPVRAGDEVLGSLAVAGPDGGDPVRRRAVEHGATVLALELSRERAAAEAERHLRGDLVEELLAGPIGEPEARRLAERAARLGHRLAPRMWVMVIEPDDQAARTALAGPVGSGRVARAVAAAGDQASLTLTVVQRSGAIIVLVPDPGDAARVDRVAQRCVAEASAAAGGGSFSCGLSGSGGPPERLHALGQQARMAQRAGRALRRAGSVNAYHRLGAERLLLAVSPASELEGFVAEWLGTLEEHDRRGPGSAPLVETLRALAESGWSPRGAARAMNVHVNTLLYRLQRVRDVTGRDLGAPDVRLAFSLALKARDMSDAGAGVPAARLVS